MRCKNGSPMLSDRCTVVSVCLVCKARVLWPKGWINQDETWHAGRPRPGHIVLGGDPAPPHAKGHSPHFFAHICCGQMAGCIKLPVGMEVGLGPGGFVFDGDPARPCKKGQSPQFLAHVYCGQTAGWITMAHGMKVGFGPGHIVLDGDPAPPHQKGAKDPNFWPISIVAKWLDASGYHLVQRQASA